MSLPALLAAATSDATSLSLTVEPEWLQGRTCYGGLSAALAYRATSGIAHDLPPLRSAQIAFVGPLADTVHAKPVLLRRGKNTAFVSCDVTGDAGIGLRALFLFASSRESRLAWSDIAPLDFQPPGAIVAYRPPMPLFLKNFDVADAGEWPRGGFRRWVRLKERDGLDPLFELIAIADALPPAAMALGAQFVGPVSTTTWQLNLVNDAPATTDGWWLIETVTLDVGDGTSSQAMTIHNRNGDAVATATQSVALFF